MPRVLPGTTPGGSFPTAVRAIKEAGLDLLVITDVCLCEYTDHGHCGLLGELAPGPDELEVDNDRTVELLAREALVYAEAGADIIAPSDMMDGRIGRIRTVLDANGFFAPAGHVVRGKVCLCFLRALPGSRGFGAPDRRQAQLPDGPAQQP